MIADSRFLRLAALLGITIAGATTVVACGDDETASSASAGGGSTERPAQQELAGKTLTYVGANSYKTFGCAAKARVEELGGELREAYSKEFTAASLTPVLNAALAASPDGLLVSPTDPKALYAPIKAASERMPVATVLNTLENRDPVTTEVVFDNVSAGRTAAEHLIDKAAGKPVKIAAFSFTAGASRAADEEVKGFEDTIEQASNVTFLGTQYVGAQDTAGATARKLGAVLAANPDLFGVFAHAGDTGTGALAALRQRKSDALLVANYSVAFPEVIEGLERGGVDAVVDFEYADAAKAGVDELVNEISGRPAKATVPFEAKLFTKQSLEDPQQRALLYPDAKC